MQSPTKKKEQLQKQLKLRQFVPIDRDEEIKYRFDGNNPYNINKLNELRERMISDNNDVSFGAQNDPGSIQAGLISLNDIMLKQVGD